MVKGKATSHQMTQKTGQRLKSLESLADAVRGLRAELGLTQEGLAREAGLTVRTVVRYEAGFGPKPDKALVRLGQLASSHMPGRSKEGTMRLQGILLTFMVVQGVQAGKIYARGGRNNSLRPVIAAYGNAAELRKMADLLDIEQKCCEAVGCILSLDELADLKPALLELVESAFQRTGEKSASNLPWLRSEVATEAKVSKEKAKK
jgi:DNA-binding XRE family transcriptional regulator